MDEGMHEVYSLAQQTAAAVTSQPEDADDTIALTIALVVGFGCVAIILLLCAVRSALRRLHRWSRIGRPSAKAPRRLPQGDDDDSAEEEDHREEEHHDHGRHQGTPSRMSSSCEHTMSNAGSSRERDNHSELVSASPSGDLLDSFIRAPPGESAVTVLDGEAPLIDLMVLAEGEVRHDATKQSADTPAPAGEERDPEILMM